MASRGDRVAALLIDLESVLRNAGLWAATAPTPQAMQSQLPFCTDTLTLEQWLQFVFLPQLHVRIDQHLPLPTACAIAPAAEQMFTGDARYYSSVVRVLRAIDQLLTECN